MVKYSEAFSQESICKKLNISQSSLSAYENGKTEWPFHVLSGLSTILDMEFTMSSGIWKAKIIGEEVLAPFNDLNY